MERITTPFPRIPLLCLLPCKEVDSSSAPVNNNLVSFASPSPAAYVTNSNGVANQRIIN